ncbi:MAG: ATP-dependent helicase [Bacillota bacterium]|nr:ATP-dependent helicase [Bacillota bacterium]
MHKKIDNWDQFLQAELNRAQYEFATADDDALLGLAGPGSGKTRALVYRAAHLIQTGLNPGNLLLLTFTNKAAGEMKERLERLLGFLPYELWSGTFHSIGARILRKHAALMGRTPNFSIFDEDDSRALLKQILALLEVNEQDRKLIMQRGFLGRIISQARNSDFSIRHVMEEDYPYRLEYYALINEVADIYNRKKEESNAFDFDDLLLCWLELFENQPQVREQYLRRFKHVLVDEFQDTNIIQARLIDLFAGNASLCVVGDDAQSIYAFRYANIGNILSFPEKYQTCRLVRMEQNYRSTPEIVELANCSISFNREQLPKKLYSENPPGPKPLIAKVYDARQEASFVLQNIWELQNNGIPMQEIAVLYRSSYLTPELEFTLSGRGISYRTFGGVKFFQKAHIKDLLAYLKVINNPQDEQAWRRISLLQQGIGPAGFEKLWLNLKDYSNPLEAALSGKESPSRGKNGWTQLCETLAKINEHKDGKVADLINGILEDNYDQLLKQNYPDQYEERLSGLERLAIYSERFETVEKFLESLTLEESVFADPDAYNDTYGGQLTLSTIHSAKGKEWDAVFIIGLNQGHFPGRHINNHDLDEERRLFYVAATRARRYLYMTTYWEDYRSYGATSEGPSLFLKELAPECYQLADYANEY